MDWFHSTFCFKVEKYKDDGSTTLEACKSTEEKISQIYLKASIKTINPKKIVQKVQKLLNLKRSEELRVGVDNRTGKAKVCGKQKKRSRNHKVKLKLGDVLNKIFDVAKEVPDREIKFYEDQQTVRKMFIGQVDQEVTQVLNEEAEREEAKQVENARLEESRARNAQVMKEREDREAEKKKERFKKVGWKDLELEDSEDEEVLIKKRRRMSKDETEHLGNFLAHGERFQVSETALSAIYNLQKEQLESDHRLTQSQIHRKKQTMRIKKVKTFENEKVTAIGFDERIDWTKMEAGVGVNGHKRFVKLKQEHCVVITYPEAEFAGHVVPRDGTGASLGTDINQFTLDRKIAWKDIKYLVSDGCEKMLGWKTGVHATLEKIHGVPFGRIICVFHHIEKSFECVFLLYTGHTSSPGSYSGGIGKMMKGDIHKLPLADFQVLPNPVLLTLLDQISEETFRSFSNDHQIFFGLLRIAITGEVVERWLIMKIGEMITSRFTTTEVRVVRLWLSTNNPSFEHTRVMSYIVNVWGPVFAQIKQYNLFIEAPRALLLEVMLTAKHCSYPERTLLSSSMSPNGQMAHPESVLPSMLASTNPEERRRAVDIIFSIREQGPRVWDAPTGVRPFKVHKSIFVFTTVHPPERRLPDQHGCYKPGDFELETPCQCCYRTSCDSMPFWATATGLQGDSPGAGPASYLCGCGERSEGCDRGGHSLYRQS